jgi:hypothetical protein
LKLYLLFLGDNFTTELKVSILIWVIPTYQKGYKKIMFCLGIKFYIVP